MADPRHLRNAPITEMLFDVRLAAPTELTEVHFESIRRTVADGYPRTELKQAVQGTVKIEQGRLVTDSEPLGLKGLFVKSADDLTIGQFRSDGFTFNRLRPYTSWDELFPEAMRLWRVYADVSGQTVAARIALRYINHFEVPLQHGDDFELFLVMPPNIPAALPQLVSAFFTQFTAFDQASEMNAIVTQSLGAAPSTRLFLDVDVFKQKTADGEDAVRDTFTALHDFKNRVFFNLLTERCLQLFQ